MREVTGNSDDTEQRVIKDANRDNKGDGEKHRVKRKEPFQELQNYPDREAAEISCMREEGRTR